MTNISLRLYALLCLLLTYLSIWAQDDDDLSELVRKGTDDLTNMEEMVDYRPFHIRFSDILMVILLVAACYVFGKIWKGCIYLIIAVAVLFYFMTH